MYSVCQDQLPRLFAIAQISFLELTMHRYTLLHNRQIFQKHFTLSEANVYQYVIFALSENGNASIALLIVYIIRSSKWGFHRKSKVSIWAVGTYVRGSRDYPRKIQ